MNRRVEIFTCGVAAERPRPAWALLCEMAERFDLHPKKTLRDSIQTQTGNFGPTRYPPRDVLDC
jgi:hypothetical protein